MSLDKLSRIIDLDEEILKEFERRYDDSGVFKPDQNHAFQGLSKEILDLENTIREVIQLRKEGNYLKAFKKLKSHQNIGVEDFREFEKEASDFVSQEKLRYLDELNKNFEAYKKEACVEILEESMAEGKKKCDGDSLEIWIKEESLKKAFSYVSQNTVGKNGKECAGIFVMKSSGKGKIICQDFRPLNDDEAQTEEKSVQYTEGFKEKLRNREKYNLALMHSHPAHKVSGYPIRLTPSNPQDTTGYEQFNNDLVFFDKNGLILNFIISTAQSQYPQNLYISAIGMPIGPTSKSSSLTDKMEFHAIQVINEEGRVKMPAVSNYNRLVYLWKNSKEYDLDKIAMELGEYQEIIFE